MLSVGNVFSEQGAAAISDSLRKFQSKEQQRQPVTSSEKNSKAGKQQQLELHRLQGRSRSTSSTGCRSTSVAGFLFTGGATVTSFSGGKQRPDWEGTAAIQLIRGFPTSVARGGRSSRRGGARTGSGRTEVARRRRARGGSGGRGGRRWPRFR